MAQPFSAGTERSRDTGRTSLRSQHARLPAFSMPRPATCDLLNPRPDQAAICSTRDLLEQQPAVVA
ncbi:UNVERIFIED_CONTAM: hypothetical protein Slati_4440800 [Sesamum latifolium]|uniref:Uncharacterized protein n=1 Tax=Sesamum latifolium TaxID=2727402 RepID=A0AAW2SQ92_9LAMI